MTMQVLWRHFYSYLLIPTLYCLIRVTGVFNEKVRRGIRGRKDLFGSVGQASRSLRPGLRIWFHSSSMGEFEQAKPIIAELKRRRPDVLILVTFYSPSGYEHSKNYPLADLVTYLPFDSRHGAKRFIEILKPDIAVLVRYDVWPNVLWELNRHGIPILIANATMQRQSLRCLPIVRSFHRSVYNVIDEILTVSESDAQAFKLFRLNHARITAIGDTRYDQVRTRSREALKRHIIPQHILQDKRLFVAGSCWPEDDAVLLPTFLQLQSEFHNLLMIHVPHEPTVEYLQQLESNLAGKTAFIRFSALNEYAGERVIIVDRVGILLTLYGSAHVAYIGGSFHQGIHNILEAAVFGIPVLFGPRHQNSQEPLMLVERGGGFVVSNSAELRRTLGHLLSDECARKETGKRAEQFVLSNTGATERILSHLMPHMEVRSVLYQREPAETLP
jgi:3-deoxy-D-manno-octulosonic-acid transferase